MMGWSTPTERMLTASSLTEASVTQSRSPRGTWIALVGIPLASKTGSDVWVDVERADVTVERHKIVIDWLKQIFDPKRHPCFRDEFIHPTALVPLMTGARESFGLDGYVAPGPALG